MGDEIEGKCISTIVGLRECSYRYVHSEGCPFRDGVNPVDYYLSLGVSKSPLVSMATNWQKNTSNLDILRTHGFAVPSSAQGMVQILSVLGRCFRVDAVGHDHHRSREC